MGIGISLILIAVGGILTWGVVDTATGINIAAVGVILMLVGLIGLVMTLAFWSSFSPFASSAPFQRGRGAGYDDQNVVVHREPRQRQNVVVRDDRPTETVVTTTTERSVPTERVERVVVREPDDRL